MRATGRPELRVLASIGDVPTAAWSAVVQDEPLLSPAWLQLVESSATETAQHRYLLLSDSAGLAAVAIARLVPRGSAGGGVDRMLFGRLASTPQRAGLSILPALVCGVYEGTAAPMAWRANLGDEARSQACAALIDELEREARQLGVPLAFSELPADEPVLQAELGRRAYARLDYLPGCRMEIAGKDLLEHVRASPDASRSVDKDVRRERNRIAQAGIRIARLAGDAVADARIAAMFAANYAKHGTGPFPFNADFLERLHRLGPDRLAVFAAHRDGQLLGASCLVHGGPIAYGKYFGVCPDEAETAFLYFGLVFHAPVAFAAEQGIRRLEFGRGMYPAKTRRGCRLVGTRAYLQPRSLLGRTAMRGWSGLASRWYRRKVAP